MRPLVYTVRKAAATEISQLRDQQVIGFERLGQLFRDFFLEFDLETKCGQVNQTRKQC